MNNIFAFVEPSFYGVKYVERAKNLGFNVLVLVSSKDNPIIYGYKEYYDDLIVCDITDKNSIYEKLKNYQNIDNVIGLLPATDYATINTVWVAEKIGLKSMSLNSAIAVRNKDIARELFEAENVSGPQYKIVKTLEEAEEFSKKIGFPLVLKPTNTASSQFVSMIENSKDLKEKWGSIIGFKESYMGFKVNDYYLLEEFMSGNEYSLEVFLEDSKVIFSEITQKIKTPPPYFVEIGHILPAKVNNKDRFVKIAKEAAIALSITDGPLHIEVIDTKNGLKIVEVNGRPGGDEISAQLIPLSFGIDIFKNTILNYLNKPLHLKKQKNEYSSIIYIYTEKKGILEKIYGLSEIEHLEYVKNIKILKKEGDIVSPLKSSDDRIGYIVIQGKRYEEILKNIEYVRNNIEIKIKNIDESTKVKL